MIMLRMSRLKGKLGKKKRREDHHTTRIEISHYRGWGASLLRAKNDLRNKKNSRVYVDLSLLTKQSVCQSDPNLLNLFVGGGAGGSS